MALGEYLGMAARFGRPISKDKVLIASFIDRLNYRATVILLFGASLVISAAEFTGPFISCISDFNSEVLFHYCSFNSYTLSSCYKNKYGGNKHCIFTGVGHDYGDGERKYHKAYRWAPALLFCQAMLFYVPHFVWKLIEGDRVGHLADFLRGEVIDPEAYWGLQKRATCVAQFVYKTLYRNQFFYMGYLFYQILTLANIVGNMYFIDWYLDGAFYKMGFEGLNMINRDPYDTSNYLAEVFPLMTKCSFTYYGASGTAQEVDALCMLNWNLLHEKVYLFFWLWLVLLFLLSSVQLGFRLAELLFPFVRRFRLQSLLPRPKQSKDTKSTVHNLEKRLSLGTYYMIYLLGQNMDPFVFKFFTDDLSEILTYGLVEPPMELAEMQQQLQEEKQQGNQETEQEMDEVV